MIRLGVVSLSAYPVFVPASARGFGGSEVQLGRLCRAIAQRDGWRVELLTSGEGDYCLREVDGVLIHKLPWNPAGNAVSRARLALALRAEIARTAPDLYVQRCLGIETGMVGLWCKKKKRPFIYMTASDWDCDGTYDRRRHPAATRYSHLGMRAADLILTQSERHRAMLRGAYGLESIVLPSLCDTAPPSHEPREFWLWIGRCEESKQPQLFLDLAAAFPQEEFVIIAPPSNYPEFLHNVSTRAQALPNARYIAHVPHHEIDAWYRKARGLINTSTQEGFPNVFLEAGRHGVPVLSLNVNPDDYLRRYDAGVCVDGDFEAMKNVLRSWRHDDAARARAGENGRAYIAQRHATELVVERFLELANGVLEARNRKAK